MKLLDKLSKEIRRNEAPIPEKIIVLNEITKKRTPKWGRSQTIMGVGSNLITTISTEELEARKMVEEAPVDTSDISSDTNDSCIPPIIARQLSPVLRLRNRAMSRSERNSKGRSVSSETGSKKFVRKTVSDVLDAKRSRPTSQFYVSDEFFTGSGSDSSLLRKNSITSGSHPVLSSTEKTPDMHQEGASSTGFMPHYMRTSTPHLSTVDNLLQRFRKSFMTKFQRKKLDLTNGTASTLDTNGIITKSVPECLNGDVEEVFDDPQITVPNKPVVTAFQQKDQNRLSADVDKSGSPLNFHSLVLRTMRERKVTRRKAENRMSLFCDKLVSSDEHSVNGSVSQTSTLGNCSTGSDANLLRKRAASTSDYSPKSKNGLHPISIIDNFAVNGTSGQKNENKPNCLRNDVNTSTSNDVGSKEVLDGDQSWKTNPVKLCRVHSRLLMCRHKGRYRLRRSISQPIELESLGSVHNLHSSTQGLTDQDNFHKCSSSDDDAASSDSDIYHSFCCSPTRRSNTCWELTSEGGIFAEALWDHETSDSEELPFQAGDLIEVTDTSDQEWWWGTRAGRGGWFPSAFVRLHINHRVPSNNFSSQQSNNVQSQCSSPCKGNLNNLSCEQVRANIVQEIVATERDYVKHLKDVVEGYLKQVQRRPDMFSRERIDTVFGNIKDIYLFQSQFLKDVELCLSKDSLHLSQIGNCFLKNKENFKMYSEYCNNHPLAVSELQELYCESQYIHFFEACRLLQEMIDISLDGFLLTPIQRICKYPLQLAELLKFTDIGHPDHIPVTKAFAAMKEVAELVNERKRRMECLERLAEWQNTIEGWEGTDLLDNSSILIHCGEVTRVTSSWSRDVYIFIFDHLLVYCKKDLLKRHTYAYKGRLNLDDCDIVDIDDGRDPQFALNVKNAWKLFCRTKEKWYLFYAKTAAEKEQWLSAFSIERKRVEDDKEQGFVVTEEAKKAARTAVLNKQKPKRPRAKFTKNRRQHPDVAVTELLLDVPSAKSRTGSLPSNIHPELAIMAGAKMGPPRKKGSGWFHFGSGKKPKS